MNHFINYEENRRNHKAFMSIIFITFLFCCWCCRNVSWVDLTLHWKWVCLCVCVCVWTCVWLSLLCLILLRCFTICRAYYRNHYIPICNGLLWWEYNKPVTHKMVFTPKDEASSCVVTLSLLTHSPSDLWEGNWLLLHTCQQASSETKTMGILPVGVMGVVWYPLMTSVIEINASRHINYMYIYVKVKKSVER